MLSGQLKEVIEIYEPIVTVDEYGNQTTDYKQKYRTRAKVVHTSGKREEQNNELVYIHEKIFYTRRYLKVYEFCLIKWKGKNYRIIDIVEKSEYNELVITTEVVNE